MAKPAQADHNVIWILAEAFQQAAETTIQHQQEPGCAGFIRYPIAFLHFRTIELALKAALLSRGLGYAEVRRLGHKLNALLKACQDRGIDQQLGLDPEALNLIAPYLDQYAHKWYEYPEDLWEKMPDAELMRRLVGKLIEKTKLLLHSDDDLRGGAGLGT